MKRAAAVEREITVMITAGTKTAIVTSAGGKATPNECAGGKAVTIQNVNNTERESLNGKATHTNAARETERKEYIT